MKLHLSNNWKIYIILLFFYFLTNLGNTAKAQYNYTGIIWVEVNRTDALPENGNLTGNSGVNLIFEDFNVIEYKFIDSLYIEPYLYKIPIYQIRLDEDYADLDLYFMYLLNCCYGSFFPRIANPYYHPFDDGQTLTVDNGEITIYFYEDYFDPTLIPRTNTRSYNKSMNLILKKYDIKSYEYSPFVFLGDTVTRTIKILCDYEDVLPLYYDLLTNHSLYEELYIANFYPFEDIAYPCGSYSGVSNEKEPFLTIYPNPAQNEIFVLGVNLKSIIVYDVMGKMVVSEFDAETNKIDIKMLPNGLYIIKIITFDRKLYTKKIIKQ